MPNKFTFASLLSFAFLVPTLPAIVVSGNNPNDPVYLSSVTGVGTYSQGGFLCSGSLLSTGMHFLTAAHCLLDGNGNPLTGGATITFTNLLNTSFSYNSTSIIGNPSFDYNNFFGGNDLAIVTLGQQVDSSITRLNLYSGSGELNQTGTVIGYGRQGVGATGSVSGTFGTRREGQNQVDEIFGGNILIYDFDNGLAAQNSRGGLGLGLSEVNIAPGDSGGPTLIGGSIAGIHSFITCTANSNPNLTCRVPPDVDTTLNSSFGERFGDTRVSLYTQWIQSVTGPLSELNSIPEPSTVFAGLAALATCLARARKTRNGSPN